jgi:predicted glycosyltransferase
MALATSTRRISGQAPLSRQAARSAERTTKTIWIDLDNSPHVPFFAPIIEELKQRGYRIRLTARDAFQVKELVELYHFDCKCIGHHYGKHKLLKLFGVLIRALQLLPLMVRNRPDLAVAHGSRAQLTLATALRIPTLHIGDYEHATGWAIIHPSWVLVPEVIPAEGIQEPEDRILRYPGIKEDVYVPQFKPDPLIRRQLHLSDDDIVVTVRPPASEAHYHNPLSDVLFSATVEFLRENPRVKIVLLPRNQRQADAIQVTWPQLFDSGRMIIPSHVVDGLNLIWYSDLVISGGGTMNREAAALGVPVYSIFRGKTGAVDRYLSANGRLVMIETPADLPLKVSLVQRHRPAIMDSAQRPALQAIVNHIVAIVEKECGTQTSKTTA